MNPVKTDGIERLKMNSVTTQDFARWSQELKDSDQSAFEQIFNHFYSALLGYASRILNSREVAKDIVQEAFITLWNKRENIDPAKSVKSLLYRIVYTRCLNQIRDKREFGYDTEQMNQVADTDTENTEPDFSTDVNELGEILESVICKLPERQREAFLLSRQEGLTHDEIANIMDCRPATVNNHITSAMKNLRNHLMGMNIEGYQ